MLRSVILFAVIAVVVFMAAIAFGQTPTSPTTELPTVSVCNAKKTVCLSPEVAFNFTGIYLNGPDQWKKYAGVGSNLGAGGALLFWADQWYATGPALHAAFALDQANPNFVSLSGGLTILRYLHFMINGTYQDSQILYSAVFGLTVQPAVVTTAVASARAQQAARSLQ